jgi:hypothetical protein
MTTDELKKTAEQLYAAGREAELAYQIKPSDETLAAKIEAWRLSREASRAYARACDVAKDGA